MNLESILGEIVRNENRYSQHYGTVTAITNTSGTYYLTVQIAGSSTAITKVRYLRSYVPRVNDTVLVNIYKNDAIVVGALASADKSLNPVAYRTTVQTIPQNVDTDVSFEAVANDDWDMWDIASPTVLTCKVPGRYMAFGQILLELASNIDVELKIYKNSTEIGRQDSRMTNASHDWHTQVNTPAFTMAINDTIKLVVNHNNNPDLDLEIISSGIDHTGYFPSLNIIYLGP